MRELLAVTFVVGAFGFAAGNAATIDVPQVAFQPQATVDASGTVHLTFGAQSKVYYTRSSDAGATFSEPIEVAKLDSLALGMRRGPRIAASADAVVISAIGNSGAEGDGNLYAWRSTDKGATWNGPLQINDKPASAREGLHGMAAGPTGEACCVWLDLRQKGTQIFASRSTDGGATWSRNRVVYQSPDGTVCECCHPSVAIDAIGRVYVMWRNFLDGNRDMFLAMSTDHGETFASAVKLGDGSWPLDACPMDGGALAISPDGTVLTVWRRDQQVLLTDDEPTRESILGVGRQPWAAADQHGYSAVWLSGPTGKLHFTRSGADAPVVLADEAQHPIVAAHPSRRGPVIAAWEAEGSDGPQIKVVRVEENH